MSSYFITNAPTAVVGTVDNDTFFIATAQSSTIQGVGGDDTISASFGAVGETRNSTIQGGPGADKMFLSAPSLKVDQFFFAGGADNDRVEADIFNTISGSTINGGGGLDTVRVSAWVANDLVVNGNQDRDIVDVVFGAGGASARVAGGGDIDTITVSSIFAAPNNLTVAGGGGDDVISARVSGGQGLRVFGDDVDGAQGGFDRINVQGVIGSGANINGQGGADTITVSASANNFFTIGGAEGQDIINVRLNGNQAGSVNGGAAADIINWETLVGSGTSVTINGGDGEDRITVSGRFNGILNAGAGADNIGIGASASSTRITYNADTVSTLASTDYVSAEKDGGNLYFINQSLVDAQTANIAAVPAGVNIVSSFATFNPPAGVGVTARMSILDQVTTQGTVVSFDDGLGNNFIFIQAGAQNSGITNDVLIQTEERVDSFDISNGGRLIQVRDF